MVGAGLRCQAREPRKMLGSDRMEVLRASGRNRGAPASPECRANLPVRYFVLAS